MQQQVLAHNPSIHHHPPSTTLPQSTRPQINIKTVLSKTWFLVMALFLIVDFASKQTHGNCQNPVTVECDWELRSLSKHLCQGGKLAELAL